MMATTLEKRSRIGWVDVARELGKDFRERAAGHDANRGFVADNYQDLRDGGLFWAGIPEELGGGGASFEDMCGVIREVGRQCGSTALAFSMHTHPVLLNVFKHLRGDEGAAVTLRKITAKQLVIATTGANDWLPSSGEAEPAPGGYRVSAHKRFVSGAPGAQLFVTSVHRRTPDGGEILHFAVPMRSEGVEIVDTWNALGMRGTGSHDVILDGVFVPEESIVLRRPAGEWHPVWDVVLPTAMPLICAAYVGLAEAAREEAVRAAGSRPTELAPAVGEMMNSLTIARMTLADMIRLNDDHGFTPSVELSSDILTRKAILNDAVKATVEIAAELVGGPGFLHGHPMERIVRDVRALHFHPLPKRRQSVLSGRVALGLDPVTE
jgi:acyl-CoA dehydrogenase